MVAVAVSALALAATAESASAISIEPLNKKFEGSTTSSIEMTANGVGSWSCAKATIAGTTNSTKTNYVNVTPAITGCFIAEVHTMTYANVCKEKGTVPWTFTLTAGTGPFTGTVKLSCAFTLTIDTGECVVRVPEQTIEKHLEWSTIKATEPFESKIALNLEKIKYEPTGPHEGVACTLWGFKKGGELSIKHMEFSKITGIKAV